MLSTRSSASTIHPLPLSDGIQPFFASGTICAGVGGVVLREVVRQAATATLLRPRVGPTRTPGSSAAWRAAVVVRLHWTASAEAAVHVSAIRWYREATGLKAPQADSGKQKHRLPLASRSVVRCR